MYNLFLDDERNPNRFLKDLKTWEVVRGYDDFTRIIRNRGLPGFISFDHDLSSKEKTGYDCAKWLIEYCQKTKKPLPNWQVHSLNPIGKVNINELLIQFKEGECL